MENLLTADQALGSYNADQIRVEEFFKSVIEPQIRQVYQADTSIVIKVNEIWYVGTQIDGLQTLNNTNLTKPFLQLLDTLGYTYEMNIESSGNEYQNGYGTLTIKWGGEN